MEDPHEAFDPFQRLKISLGSLLLCWAWLETALSEATRTSRDDQKAIAKTFHDKLNMLRTDLEHHFQGNEPKLQDFADLITKIDDLRKKRNLIVHHLAGICADPLKGDPYIICEKIQDCSDKSIKITQSELTDIIQSIVNCHHILKGLDFTAGRAAQQSPQRAAAVR